MRTLFLSKVEIFFEVMIDTIIAFTDHFIVAKHITLSEATVFCLAFGRAVWFTIFGVNIGAMSQPMTNEMWLPFFWLLTIAHVGAFFVEDKIYRIIVLCTHALVWCFLALLVAITSHGSSSVPTFLTFSLLSVIMAVRLIKDRRD